MDPVNFKTFAFILERQGYSKRLTVALWIMGGSGGGYTEAVLEAICIAKADILPEMEKEWDSLPDTLNW